jgi:hypothetical protein
VRLIIKYLQRLIVIISTINSTVLLKGLLSNNPKLSLSEIRRAHPIFHAMSWDHLGLRVGQIVDALADRRTK